MVLVGNGTIANILYRAPAKKGKGNYSKSMESFSQNLQNYLEKMKAKPVVSTKARNYKEELALQYLPHINWDNDKFENHISLFWIGVNRFWKMHTPDQFVRLMNWVKDRNCHPLVVYKLLNKKP